MHIALRLRRRFDNPVNGALDGVVAPSRQQIAGIDDTSPLDRRGVHELAVRALDLQPAGRVLEEQRDGAVVGVLARAHLARVDLEHLLVHGGVVQQTQGVVAHVEEAVEEVGVDAHSHGDRAHYLDVKRLALREKIGHGGFEAHQLALLGGPLVWVTGLVLAPNLEAFLDIGSLAANLVDFCDIGQLCYLLTAWSGVAAVRLRSCPAMGELGINREFEELGRSVKDVLAGLGGDGDVAEVNEAGGLEPLEDRFRRLELLGLVAVEKPAEIYQLRSVSDVKLTTRNNGDSPYRDKKSVCLHCCFLHLVVLTFANSVVITTGAGTGRSEGQKIVFIFWYQS